MYIPKTKDFFLSDLAILLQAKLQLKQEHRTGPLLWSLFCSFSPSRGFYFWDWICIVNLVYIRERLSLSFFKWIYGLKSKEWKREKEGLKRLLYRKLSSKHQSDLQKRSIFTLSYWLSLPPRQPLPPKAPCSFCMQFTFYIITLGEKEKKAARHPWL